MLWFYFLKSVVCVCVCACARTCVCFSSQLTWLESNCKLCILFLYIIVLLVLTRVFGVCCTQIWFKGQPGSPSLSISYGCPEFCPLVLTSRRLGFHYPTWHRIRHAFRPKAIKMWNPPVLCPSPRVDTPLVCLCFWLFPNSFTYFSFCFFKYFPRVNTYYLQKVDLIVCTGFTRILHNMWIAESEQDLLFVLKKKSISNYYCFVSKSSKTQRLISKGTYTHFFR